MPARSFFVSFPACNDKIIINGDYNHMQTIQEIMIEIEKEHESFIKRNHGYSKCGAHLTWYKVNYNDKSCYTCPECQMLCIIEDLPIEHPNLTKIELLLLKDQLLSEISEIYPKTYRDYIYLGDRKFIKKYKP